MACGKLCGSDNSNAICWIIPHSIAGIIYAVLWGIIFTFNIVLWYIEKFSGDLYNRFDSSSWNDWIAIIGVTISGIYYGLLVIFWCSATCKPKKVLQSLICPGQMIALVGAIWYWIDYAINVNDEKFLNDPNEDYFIAATIFYCILFCTWWFQLTSIKSLLKIHKYGGSGWNIHSPDHYKEEAHGESV